MVLRRGVCYPDMSLLMLKMICKTAAYIEQEEILISRIECRLM